MDAQLIPPWIRRRNPVIVARTASNIINPFRDNIALDAPAIIRDAQPIPPWIRRRDPDSAVRTAINSTDMFQDNTALAAPDIIRDAILIPKSILRRNPDIAAPNADVLTLLTRRDSTALTATAITMDSQPILAFLCRRFRDLQYRRERPFLREFLFVNRN